MFWNLIKPSRTSLFVRYFYAPPKTWTQRRHKNLFQQQKFKIEIAKFIIFIDVIKHCRAKAEKRTIELKYKFHIEWHLMIFMTGKLNIDKIINKICLLINYVESDFCSLINMFQFHARLIFMFMMWTNIWIIGCAAKKRFPWKNSNQ